MRKLKQAFTFFFELKKIGEKANAPKFLQKNEKYSIIFQKQSFKIQKNKIRLSLGKEIKNILREKNHSQFLYIKKHHNATQEINQIEIVPKYNGRYYTIHYIYENTIKETENCSKIEDFAAIDLGEVNLASIYSPNGSRPLIISGKEIKEINNRTYRTIKYLNKKHKQYTNYHYQIWERRENKIMNYMHCASSKIIKYCQLNNIKKLVIGYNINWKNKINMGRKNNGKFYSIPYRRFVNMIFYKGLQEGINVVETDESYTSKCDALTNEEVQFQRTYTGHRKHRGLFTSGIGFSINADINGAINILRNNTLTAIIASLTSL